jgi:hypothetical protein
VYRSHHELVDKLFKNYAQKFWIELQFFIIKGVFFKGKIEAKQEGYKVNYGFVRDEQSFCIVIFVRAKKPTIEVWGSYQMSFERLGNMGKAVFVFAGWS